MDAPPPALGLGRALAACSRAGSNYALPQLL